MYKKNSTSSDIRELQIKTIMTYNTPIRKAKIQNTGTSNADKNIGQKKLSLTAVGITEWYLHSGRQFGSVLQN